VNDNQYPGNKIDTWVRKFLVGCETCCKKPTSGIFLSLTFISLKYTQ
jgi:hypothetical protein